MYSLSASVYMKRALDLLELKLQMFVGVLACHVDTGIRILVLLIPQQMLLATDPSIKPEPLYF